MFKTFMGPVEEDASVTYLRPETAQGIFVNFDNVLQSTRRKLPFGIAQIGKAFRNEITPGNFIFRTREFEQMEIEYFVNPHDTIDGRPGRRGLARPLDRGLPGVVRALRPAARAPASCTSTRGTSWPTTPSARSTSMYQFPMGWSELMGIANRTDFDLKQHAKFSGKSLTYFDEERKEHVVPFVIEPSAGVDRALLAFLLDAYREEEVRGEKRVVLRFHPELAPVKIAVLPLLKKRAEIVATGHELRARLARRWVTHLRRHRGHRPALPAPGRGGHAVLRDRRREDGRRRRQGRGGRPAGDDPRARLDGADPGADRRAASACSSSCSSGDRRGREVAARLPARGGLSRSGALSRVARAAPAVPTGADGVAAAAGVDGAGAAVLAAGAAGVGGCGAGSGGAGAGVGSAASPARGRPARPAAGRRTPRRARCPSRTPS